MALHRKHGDRRPLRLSLDRDLTGIGEVVVRIGRAAGGPAVIDKTGTIEEVSAGVVRLDLTAGEAENDLTPGRWLIEARPADGSIHPDQAHEILEVHARLEAAPAE